MSKEQIKVIKGLTLGSERALYNTNNAFISSCTFEGIEDGESALKECHDIKVEDCTFSLRYPLWHASNFEVSKSRFTKTCRAPLWYDNKGIIKDIHIEGLRDMVLTYQVIDVKTYHYYDGDVESLIKSTYEKFPNLDEETLRNELNNIGIKYISIRGK